jgi:hypothetical protein
MKHEDWIVRLPTAGSRFDAVSMRSRTTPATVLAWKLQSATRAIQLDTAMRAVEAGQVSSATGKMLPTDRAVRINAATRQSKTKWMQSVAEPSCLYASATNKKAASLRIRLHVSTIRKSKIESLDPLRPDSPRFRWIARRDATAAMESSCVVQWVSP